MTKAEAFAILEAAARADAPPALHPAIQAGFVIAMAVVDDLAGVRAALEDIAERQHMAHPGTL